MGLLFGCLNYLIRKPNTLFTKPNKISNNVMKKQGLCWDVFTRSGTKRIEYYDVSLNQFSTVSHSHTAV